jgi:hypothetical protein
VQMPVRACLEEWARRCSLQLQAPQWETVDQPGSKHTRLPLIMHCISHSITVFLSLYMIRRAGTTGVSKGRAGQ